nr:aldehyde dehydrogenase family protein [Thauera phenylacetica]
MLSNARFLPLGLEATRLREGALAVLSPIDGSLLARLAPQDAAATDAAIACSVAAFEAWRRVPAPRRGELVRRFAQALREHKALLAELVTIECGKIRSEGEGEVQEMIDICDFAVGLSRQLHGLTIASERPGHALRETWHPLGPVAVVTAFNFPVAVWAWNVAIALVCGDSLLWKPSERTPLCALACQRLLEQAAAGMEEVPRGLSAVIVGGAERAVQLADDRRVALLSAT